MKRDEPSADQLRFLEITAKAKARADDMADQARALDLMTLAREWDYIAKCLEDAIGNQLRCYPDATLLSGETVVIDRKSAGIVAIPKERGLFDGKA